MSTFTILLTNTVVVFLGALQMLMFVRAILSWLPIDDDSPLFAVIYHITEIVIAPVRAILERSEALASLPIDMSFFVTFMLLSFIQSILMV